MQQVLLWGHKILPYCVHWPAVCVHLKTHTVEKSQTNAHSGKSQTIHLKQTHEGDLGCIHWPQSDTAWLCCLFLYCNATIASTMIIFLHKLEFWMSKCLKNQFGQFFFPNVEKKSTVIAQVLPHANLFIHFKLTHVCVCLWLRNNTLWSCWLHDYSHEFASFNADFQKRCLGTRVRFNMLKLVGDLQW